MIKNALAVYHWFVRQALTGGRVVARKPTGEEVALETAEWSRSKGRNRLSPEEFELLARELAAAPDPIAAARIKERLTRSFYGISTVPKVRQQNLPPALFHHLLERIQSRKSPRRSSNCSRRRSTRSRSTRG